MIEASTILVKDKKKAFAWLILFSLISGLLWRIEVEFHGWKGLIWLSYFHIAIPLSFILFFIWVNLFFELRGNGLIKKANVFLLFWILLGYFWITWVLHNNFLRGLPLYLYYKSNPEDWVISLKSISILGGSVLLLFFPLFGFLSLRFLDIKISFPKVLYSLLIFNLSPTLSIIILMIIDHKGGSDFIHAFKSGLIYCFLFFSLGLPLIFSRFTGGNFIEK